MLVPGKHSLLRRESFHRDHARRRALTWMSVCVQASLVNSMHLPSLTSQRHISLQGERQLERARRRNSGKESTDRGVPHRFLMG